MERVTTWGHISIDNHPHLSTRCGYGRSHISSPSRNCPLGLESQSEAANQFLCFSGSQTAVSVRGRSSRGQSCVTWSASCLHFCQFVDPGKFSQHKLKACWAFSKESQCWRRFIPQIVRLCMWWWYCFWFSHICRVPRWGACSQTFNPFGAFWFRIRQRLLAFAY